MHKGIENLRILTETTFDDFPLESIKAFAIHAVKEYDKIKEENEAMTKVMKTASILIRHGNLTDPIAQRKYNDYIEALYQSQELR